MQTSSHGNIISNLDRKKRCIGEITCFTPAVLLLSRKPHLSSHTANNYADDALRAFLHFLQAFTPVFALEVMHIPQQIVKVFFTHQSFKSRGNITIFLMERVASATKRKRGFLLRAKKEVKAFHPRGCFLPTDGKFTMQSLCSLSPIFS